ncbi:MAG: FAD-binding oxidoreductase [Chitinophagaceae bacterium]|nr:MAG: FAD-binding oxidoreductase [Chitinophagaceae bacterium]
MNAFAGISSIWEKESFFRKRDVLIIGAGLSGLWSAYYLKKANPSLSVAIIERGLIPTGASTRNAGFACFGSVTELMKDRITMGDDDMVELVRMRYAGLKRIMHTFNPAEIDFTLCGGYELITKDQNKDIKAEIVLLNNLLTDAVESSGTFTLQDAKISQFGFGDVKHLIQNDLEGFLHPGKLCEQLLKLVQAVGVTILNGIHVDGYTKTGAGFTLQTSQGIELTGTRLLLCTNAFTTKLLPRADVAPARGQILVTSEIPGLKFRGAFHADEGFYYFRNLGNRVLLGGARNVDIETENSTRLEVTDNIQNALESFLSTFIMPDTSFQITDRWSGIMGMGSEKMPVIEEIEPGVFCAIRMSGMGVALTPIVGEKVAAMMSGKAFKY